MRNLNPRKSIDVVDVISDFCMSKQYQISTEAVTGSLILTDVSKKTKSHSTKSRGLLLLQRDLLIYLFP